MAARARRRRRNDRRGLHRRAGAVRVAAVEPGLVRALAYNVMLIAGVSTVLFNGNPLLRYDGYYILADLLEIPEPGAAR